MKLFNTYSGQKEEFAPQGSQVKMYVCGVTPYDHAHIGHAMSYIIFDVLRRYLEFKGYKVDHVQNFTDIDDKIINRAQEKGLTPQELANKFIEDYHQDMKALNILPAEKYPRVTEEIPAIISLIDDLVKKGYAYPASGNVYFRVIAFPQYGNLSHRNPEELMVGARVEADEYKENPLDFVLWKGAKPGEPQWDSPWGPGRPGWHVECSAMALKYLDGSRGPLDIHGGGQDLIFPHHENEIAQSESATGIPFSRFWIHNGLLRLGEEKMSKSLGNLVRVREALERFDPNALRLFVLSSHYRSPLNYSEEAMAGWQEGLQRLREALGVPISQSGDDDLNSEHYRQRFMEAMEDDLNTPQALATLFDLAREIRLRWQQGKPVRKVAQDTLRELAGVLGMFKRATATANIPIEALQEVSAKVKMPVEVIESAEEFIELLLKHRAELRATKSYALADEIRVRLAEHGILLEDTPQGTRWRREDLEGIRQE